MNSHIMRIYFKKLSLEDLNRIAVKNDIFLNDSELISTYNYIKNNYNDYIDGILCEDKIISDAYLLLEKDNYEKIYNIYLKYKKNT